MPLPRSIDSALSQYMSYPEVEWSAFGYRPPEGGILLGAWRDKDGTVFVFLLEIAGAKSAQEGCTYLLYASGHREAIENIADVISALKNILARSERKELQYRSAESRILRERSSPAFTRWIYFMALFTAIVNAFSLYLRTLPPPDALVPIVRQLYLLLVALVHFAALILLLVIILVGVGYLIRYGLLMLRRF